VHVPYALEWAHEAVADDDLPTEGWWRLDTLAGLADLVALLES
jgi:hypothetical protein